MPMIALPSMVCLLYHSQRSYLLIGVAARSLTLKLQPLQVSACFTASGILY